MPQYQSSAPIIGAAKDSGLAMLYLFLSYLRYFKSEFDGVKCEADLLSKMI